MRSNLDECDEWYDNKELENMNRDYFKTPIQGSRSGHDYGRSGPINSEPDPYDWTHIAGIIIGGFVLLLMFFAWIG